MSNNTYSADNTIALGHQVATAAVAVEVVKGNSWATCRTGYVAAQSEDMQEAFCEDFRKGVEEVEGKKAAWLTSYLCILEGAAKHGVKLDDSMGSTKAQKLVKDAKDDAKPLDEKQAELVIMFERIAQGCLNAGVSKAKLAASLKALKA